MNCDVPGCTSTKSSKLLFESPKGAIRPFWTKFLKNCGYLSVSKDRKYQICEMHFQRGFFKTQRGDNKRTLRIGAFPTLFKGKILKIDRRQLESNPVDRRELDKDGATVITPSKECIKVQRFNHPDTVKGRSRTALDDSLLEVLSFHEIGSSDIVKLSKWTKFTKPSQVKDTDDLYTCLLAICEASKAKLEKIQSAIAERQDDLRTVIAETILTSSGQASEHQNLEENQTNVIKQETVTTKVPPGDTKEAKRKIPGQRGSRLNISRKETAELFIGNVASLADSAAEEGILYEGVKFKPLQETEMIEDAQISTLQCNLAEEMAYEGVATDFASSPTFEVVQGFTIQTLPIIEIEDDSQPFTSEPTDFKGKIPKLSLSRHKAQVQKLQSLHQSRNLSSRKQTSDPIQDSLKDWEDSKRRSHRKKCKLSQTDSEI